MARKRQKWASGDTFGIHLQDGTFVLGQVVGWEPDAMNSVAIAIFDRRLDSLTELSEEPPSRKELVSVVLATRDLLDSGEWQVIENCKVDVPQDKRPYESYRRSGFVGAKIFGSGIVVEFLEAFYGLIPWDSMHDPEYFDRLLLDASKKPALARYRSD